MVTAWLVWISSINEFVPKASTQLFLRARSNAQVKTKVSLTEFVISRWISCILNIISDTSTIIYWIHCISFSEYETYKTPGSRLPKTMYMLHLNTSLSYPGRNNIKNIYFYWTTLSILKMIKKYLYFTWCNKWYNYNIYIVFILNKNSLDYNHWCG